MSKQDTSEKPPGGFDSSPLPAAPPGYTLRFTFHSARNLAPADISSASSDPFLYATLKATGVKRHKEDPDLTYRTRTHHNTTNPDWKEEWVVANVPPSGFTLKCRLYDEDRNNANDRLGNVTVKIPQVYEDWEGIPPPGQVFAAKKRVMSKRAFVAKALMVLCSSGTHMDPLVRISIEVLGKSAPPHGQMHTLAPTKWIKHFSPMIGRLVGMTVNQNEEDDTRGQGDQNGTTSQSQKYDFQANEMQLAGPVPPELYHRFVEFRPVIGSMFESKGLRGKILNKALHKQHARIYNFDQSTEYGTFEPRSEEATRQFLKMAHYDEGCRTFTYVLTLDGTFRFTETGKEFGIDLLSKHTMHSDVATYIAFSGEFLIRRLENPNASEKVQPDQKTHPTEPIPGGPPDDSPPANPSYYQLIIDNDSGTYRPNKDMLPKLKAFFEDNFPGLGVVVMHCEDQNLQDLKEAQRQAKKNEGGMMQFVLNRSQSSLSSNESDLESRADDWEQGHQSKREKVFNAVEDPKAFKKAVGSKLRHPNSGGPSQ